MSNTTTSAAANAIRILAMDAVQKANSGHPGAPMGMADMAQALWMRHLKHNPNNPTWPDRDRFVLSNGHGSMLLYALLHLTGYDLSIEDIKQFRQLHSKTAGHPEYSITPGVETTTGPLGQGITNAVGMALAERVLASTFNKPDFDIVNHHTYVFMGDGCLMEGISHEACSLAGTLKLNKLIAFWDDNGISIDGHVEHWFADDTPKRFEAYGWHVIRAVDGHDVDAVDAAIIAAKASDRPTLICCKTVIGKGSPNKQGGHDVHGAPLGADEIAQARVVLNWPHPPFEIPQDIYAAWNAQQKGAAEEQVWQTNFAAYSAQYPTEASEFTRRMRGVLPDDFQATSDAFIQTCIEQAQTIASRKSSQNTIEMLGAVLPELFGGSADLTGSNLTNWSGTQSVNDGVEGGNYLSYGVREFGMSAMMNGMTLHGGFIPYGGTFLTFSDYSRNALRMAALMKIRSIFVFTHDSIGLGEDGPTHQSIEHVSSLRLIPHHDVWRPADTVETAVAWQQAILRHNGPSSLIFSRQNLQYSQPDVKKIDDIARGAYVLRDAENVKIVLIATGSEVGLALDAAKVLTEKGVGVRVVSMPSTNVFDRQPDSYKQAVLPARIPRVAIEAGVTDFWWKYKCEAVVGIDVYGESAPAPELFKYFGFTVDRVVSIVQKILTL